jgi:hypothetical protein
MGSGCIDPHFLDLGTAIHNLSCFYHGTDRTVKTFPLLLFKGRYLAMAQHATIYLPGYVRMSTEFQADTPLAVMSASDSANCLALVVV